jgi:C-terminal processing protease CtpA/Prc
MRWFAALLVVFLAGGTVFAQSNDEWKKDVLRKIEKELKQDQERILDDIEQMIDEELGDAPAEKPTTETSDDPFLGIMVDEIEPELRSLYGLKKTDGIQVISVVEGGPAAEGGLKKNDIILNVNDRKISSLDVFGDVVGGTKKGDSLTIKVNRSGRVRTVNMDVGGQPVKTGRGPSGKSSADTSDDSVEELRAKIEKFLEEELGEQASKPAGQQNDDFNFEEFIDDFILREPKKGEDDHPLRKQLREIMKSDEGQILGELVREYLRSQEGTLSEYFERDDEGHWQIKKEFVGELDKRAAELEQIFEQYGFGTEESKKPEEKPAKSNERPWFGISPADLSDELREHLDLESGLVVDKVYGNSPAEKAGLQEKDILLRINGKDASFDLLDEIFADAAPGDELTVTLLRKGREKNVTVTLAAREGR